MSLPKPVKKTKDIDHSLRIIEFQWEFIHKTKAMFTAFLNALAFDKEIIDDEIALEYIELLKINCTLLLDEYNRVRNLIIKNQQKWERSQV